MNTLAELAARLNKFARVIALRATDDDHDIALPGEFDGGALPLFGRLANGIAEDNFGIRKRRAQVIDQFPNPIDGLRGL